MPLRCHPGESRDPRLSWIPAFAGMTMKDVLRPITAAVLGALALASAHAEPQHCVKAEIALWGDGRHDDTAALNAWFRGEEAVWADSGAPVGAAISGHRFRLSDTVYVPGGSGRNLSDFRMVWPER